MFSIPDPHQRNLSILTHKMVFKLSEIWSGLFIPDPYWILIFYPFRIPNPGSRGQKGHRIRKTVNNLTFFQNTPSQPQQQQLPAAAAAASSQLEPSPRKKPRKQQLPPPSSLSISPEWVQVKREIGVRDRYVAAVIIFRDPDPGCGSGPETFSTQMQWIHHIINALYVC